MEINLGSLLMYAVLHTNRILEKVHKDGGPVPKRRRTEAELHSNLTELETAVDQLKDEIEKLKGDLKIKEQTIAELTQEKKKKQTDECTCLPEICNIALEHLINHQTYNPNFVVKVNPVSLNASIKRMAEIVENKTTNSDMPPEIAEKENGERDIQKQADKKHGVKLLDQCQAKTEEEKSFCICKTTSNLISQINKYEEAIKTKNISKINRLWHDCIKKLDEQYSPRLKSLNAEISGIVSTSNTKKVRDQYKSFLEQKNLKTEEIEEIQEHSNLLLPEDLKYKFDQALAEVIRNTQDELDEYHQIIFNFPAAEAQLKAVYEELVLMMVQESSKLSRLDALPVTKGIRARKANTVFQRRRPMMTPKMMNGRKLLNLEGASQN